MNKKSIISLILILFFLSLTLLFGPIIINYDKTSSNTFLLNKDYSHLSRSEIIAKINQDFILPQAVNVDIQNQKTYSLNLASISAQINTNKIASTMLYRRLNQGLPAYIQYFFKPKNFKLEISFDPNQLNEQTTLLASQLQRPYIPTELSFKNNNILVNIGSTGYELNSDSLINQLVQNLLDGNFNQSITPEIKIVGFLPTQLQIDQAKSRAQKIIGKNLVLAENYNKVTIDQNTLISWIGFDNNTQTDKISDYVKNLDTSLTRDPVDAVFKFENNKVIEFKAAQNGIKIKQNELSGLISSSIEKLISSIDSSLEVQVPVITIEPNIKTGDANNLGIKELLGRGTSKFSHSTAIRNMNVEKGASIVNRVLVAPGDIFSFLKNLGEVSLDAGFKKAYVIRQGKTELDVGGGICQVSTTLFRAMLNAGLDITERKNHAYRVSYYEEDNKPGFDATVFIPSPDLKFTNDTGHFLLIQSTYDGKNKTLTYEIYGTNDGRQVEITNYRQWDAQPAPPDVWIDDPTLPVGKVIQDEHRIPGLKTAFDWTVKKADGSTLHQKTFQSNFVPWAAVYRRGTKTN